MQPRSFIETHAPGRVGVLVSGALFWETRIGLVSIMLTDREYLQVLRQAARLERSVVSVGIEDVAKQDVVLTQSESGSHTAATP